MSELPSGYPPSHVIARLEAHAREMRNDFDGATFSDDDGIEDFFTTWLIRAYTDRWDLAEYAPGVRT